ncbi:branched-chain amino acid ABC transporter permease [Anopheles sinensis]|uniref:Branched-chain amino acid ABC transporter permease n=1 Tax=Anopheles sinensis TaxID=74873 RepID=A0A084WS10_ANOSI|nr:branched-chain amino acid ABC transporter permease [Anopheles sinensis]
MKLSLPRKPINNAGDGSSPQAPCYDHLVDVKGVKSSANLPPGSLQQQLARCAPGGSTLRHRETACE